MPSYILSIVGAVPEAELSLPAPPVDLARRLARATGVSTAALDAVAARADADGDRIVYAAALVPELAVELKRLDATLESHLDADGFVRGSTEKSNHFNDRQRLREALQLLERAANQHKGALVQA